MVVLGIILTYWSECVGYGLGKQHALPYNKCTTFTHAQFHLIHSDVWGPASQPRKGGSLYCVLFVDDFTGYTWLYMLKQKSDFFSVYSSFS